MLPSRGAQPSAQVQHEFLSDHLVADWGLVRSLLSKSVDNVALLLHLIIFSATVSSHEGIATLVVLLLLQLKLLQLLFWAVMR